MFDVDNPYARELTQLAQAEREQSHLLVQRDAARADIEVATAEIAAARETIADEYGEAKQLTSLSVTSVTAMLRGTRDDKVRQHLASREAARLAGVAAEERLSQALSDLGRIEDRLVSLGDLEAKRDQVNESRLRWQAVSGEAHTGPLSAADPQPTPEATRPSQSRSADAGSEAQRSEPERLGVLIEALREVDEALVAGHLAAARLAHAALALGRPGAVRPTDPSPEDLDSRTEEFVTVLNQCDLALGTFQRELADLIQEGVEPRRVRRWDDTMAAFADHLFDDLDVVAHQIAAGERVEEVRAEVDATIHAVRVHGRALTDEAHRLSSGPRRA